VINIKISWCNYRRRCGETTSQPYHWEPNQKNILHFPLHIYSP